MRPEKVVVYDQRVRQDRVIILYLLVHFLSGVGLNTGRFDATYYDSHIRWS